MRTVIVLALKLFIAGLGAGAAIVTIDYLYRQIYLKAWMAGWRAHQSFRANRCRMERLAKDDRSMYMYNLNSNERDKEIVKENKKQLEEEETKAEAAK